MNHFKQFYNENKGAVITAIVLIILAILGNLTKNDPNIW